MTPTLQDKHVIIRTIKCLLKGEEINNIIFHDKGDNQGQYSTIYLSSILACSSRLNYLTNGSKLVIFLPTLWSNSTP